MDENCGLCGANKKAHEELNHEFNLNGDLIPKSKPSPAKKPRPVGTVIGAIDIDLRRVLLQKGLITNADFAALYDPGPSTTGDRGTGQAESTD